MKKKIFWLILLLAFITFIGINIVQKSVTFQILPYKTNYSFEDVTNAIIDDQKNIYFIDSNNQRIVKLNSAGTMQIQLMDHGKKKQTYEFVDLTVDRFHYLYAVKIEYFPFSEMIQSESIIRYRPDGKFDKEIYSIQYDEEKGISKNERSIKYIHSIDDNVNFLVQKGQTISLYSYRLSSEKLMTISETTIPSHFYVYQMAAIAQEAITFSTKSGEIYRVNEGQLVPLLVSDYNKIARGVPEALTYGFRDDIYFVDVHKNEIVRLDFDDSSEQIFLRESDIQKQGYDFPLSNIQSFKTHNDDSFVITQSERIVVFDRQGAIDGVYEKAYFQQSFIFFNWLIWLSPLMLVAILAYSIRYFHVHIMQRRTTLILKFAGLFICSMILIIVGIEIIVLKDYSNNIEEKIYQEMENIADVYEKSINGDILKNLQTPRHYMNDDYMKLKMLQEPSHYSINVLKYDRGKIYSVVGESYPMFFPMPMNKERLNVLEGNKEVENKSTIYRAIYDSDGNITGLLEFQRNDRYIKNEKAKMLQSMVINSFFIAIVIFFLFISISVYFIFPIRSLNKSVQEIARGRWETAVTVHNSDEIGILAQQVKRMRDYVRDHIQKITELNEAYYRYVPQQFLHYLGKETVLGVQLGDHTQEEKTILVFKMRSFYTFSKQLTPEENFKFINSFLKHFSPIIREHNGMISKYIGPGALTLYSANSIDAVQSAIGIRKMLFRYNNSQIKRSLRSIEIGIAIHKGPIMLGIIGEKDRLESSVISDDVNLTELLEEFSEVLGVSIVVTQSIIDDLKNVQNIHYRSLGIVNVTELNEPIQLYDVFHGDEEKIRRLKEDTKELFEKGIVMYQDGRFFDARTAFVNVIKRNPYDRVAKLYFYLCDQYFQKGAPKDWNGTLIVMNHEKIELSEVT